MYIKLYTYKNQTLLLFTADRLHKTQIEKVKRYFQFFIPVKMYQEGFSQEESDS